ncbi:MAG: hypothetical protein AAB602_02010 [Patescibacteria group bacterium]
MIQKIGNHKKQIILFMGCAGALIAIALYFLGLYPIAVVNGRIITEKQFRSASAASSFYYENLLKAYNQGNEDPKRINQIELQSEILTSLIENELIAQKLSADLGRELQYLLNEKLVAVTDSPDLKKNAATMYGMTWDDFKRQILISQAMKDILRDQLFLKKEKADDWISSAEKSANVILFSLKFKWGGSKVVAR